MSFKRVLQRHGYQTVVESDGHTLKSHRQQANRGAILKQNHELKKAKGAIRDMEWGRLAMDVPMSDIPMIDRFFPGFADPAHPDHKFQVRRFMKSPASAPYKVQAGSKTNAGHIICN